MKKVLFIGVTEYNLDREDPHLHKKFEGLSRGINSFVIARGRGLHRKMWNAEFYLVKSRILFVPLSFLVGGYLCAFKKIDAIICQGPLTEGIVGILLSSVFRKELIIEIHGDWREGPFINRKRVFAPQLKRIVPLIARLSFRRATKIRAVAEYFLRDLRQIYTEKKYFVFPTYSDLTPYFAEKDIEFKKYILTVAVLSPIKGIEFLISAFAEIHKTFPEYKLVIVGDGPSLENLKLKTKNEKLKDAVIFTGRLTPHEVKDAMKDCCVFVLPSLSEGLPRVLLEAMALSKPVIATRVGGIPEIVKDGENGFLIEPKDTDALAEKMTYLIDNPDIAQKMGGSGQKFVQENFSNEEYIKNYISMINT